MIFNKLEMFVGLALLILALIITSCTPLAQNMQSRCDTLPSVTDVEQSLKDHAQVQKQIESINLGAVFVDVEEVSSCPGKAVVAINYATDNDRERIKQIIGSNFFGIPYRMYNR